MLTEIGQAFQDASPLIAACITFGMAQCLFSQILDFLSSICIG